MNHDPSVLKAIFDTLEGTLIREGDQHREPYQWVMDFEWWQEEQPKILGTPTTTSTSGKWFTWFFTRE